MERGIVLSFLFKPWNYSVKIDFPVIADLNTKVSTKYGMLQPNVSSTQAVRAVFIIDPQGIIRSIVYYPLTTGRNFDDQTYDTGPSEIG